MAEYEEESFYIELHESIENNAENVKKYFYGYLT
jgi:hypothetical protein